jgi:predicted  nucleic acid-binding Zn-ribbon protein
MDLKSKFLAFWQRDEHERYSELCALSTAGALTEDERNELNAHVLRCSSCAELLRAYRAIARSAMPLVAPAAEPVPEQKPWSVENAKKQLLNRIEAARAAERPKLIAAPARRPGLFAPGKQFVLAMAALAALLAVLSPFLYRLGELRGNKTARNASLATLPEPRPAETVQALADQRLLEDRLAEQRADIERLEQELGKKLAAISEARLSQDKLQRNAREQDSALAALADERAALAAERDSLIRKLQETQSSLASTQERLAALQEEHNRQTVHTASLQRHINELSAELGENQEAARSSHEAALPADSDIRELMGARELYIADVFDVDRDGKPQKAFGRVFYTGGKSLIFYAFDLDKQPGVREASTFQAWGRRGPGDKHPLSMGAFRLDNAANRRWVLRFDNPKLLAQLDAVFVTVESRGGGQKPTGKQLLFSSLRIPPNHP